jgi:hypothetical protein
LKSSCVDKNASRLMRSMPSARRNGLLNCMKHNVEQESRSGPLSDPVGKRKRKFDTSVPVLQY